LAQLAEMKQLAAAAALQAEIVPARVSMLGERCRFCVACGGMLASKGYYSARFRSLFGQLPIQVRRYPGSCVKSLGSRNGYLTASNKHNFRINQSSLGLRHSTERSSSASANTGRSLMPNTRNPPNELAKAQQIFLTLERPATRT
jgi:hypothetical protein